MKKINCFEDYLYIDPYFDTFTKVGVYWNVILYYMSRLLVLLNRCSKYMNDARP